MRKIFLALAIALGMTSAINIHPVQAQLPRMSEAVRRNGFQASESMINLLTDWQNLQGQNFTVSNVNVYCLNLSCIAIAGGQYVALKTEQIDREVLKRILACAPVGCAANVSGTVERLGNTPILTYPNVVFTEGNQPLVSSSKTPAIATNKISQNQVPVETIPIDPRQTVVKLPSKSNLTCQQSIDNVKKDLVNRGLFKPAPPRSLMGSKNPRIEIDKNYIQRNYYGYPLTRTETVVITLGTIDLFSSPKLMATLGSQIIADCQSVGMIRLRYFEGNINFGYFPNNTVRTFINLMGFSGNSFDEERMLELYTRKVQTPNGESSQYQWGFLYTP
jgi:hypothetical protein